jgi:hypothetical protein
MCLEGTEGQLFVVEERPSGCWCCQLGKVWRSGTGSETHASREDLSAYEIGIRARAQLHVNCVTMSKCC